MDDNVHESPQVGEVLNEQVRARAERWRSGAVALDDLEQHLEAAGWPESGMRTLVEVTEGRRWM